MQHRGLFIGLTTIDIQFFVDVFPESNKKHKTDPPEILVGGPTTNAAVVFAHLNQGAYLASPKGRNPFSQFIDEDFKLNRIIHFDLVEKREVQPVLASVITSKENGDRSVVSHHPEKISPVISPDKLLEKVNPEILLLDGFYPEFAAEIAKVAAGRNITTVLDCGSWKQQYEYLLQFTEIAICSEDFFPPGCSNQQETIKFLEEKQITKAAISRGGKSILFYDEKDRGEIKIKQVNVADTLGAGDFLHGAFCFYYLNSDNKFSAAIERASEIATESCQYPGTRKWLNFTK